MLWATDDTIVAIASAPGYGLRGIVRLSGPMALPIASGLFTGNDAVAPASVRGFRRITGRVYLDDRRSVPAECYVFRAPRSYTRQDCVELHTVGSPPLLAMVTDRAVAAGARPAQPGEFTARAFLSGAMDLTQAEAVAAVISARSDAELRAGRRLRDGLLAQRTTAAADALADLVSLVEADIDFSEEPIEFITPGELGSRLDSLLAELRDLLETSGSTERLACLPTVLLLGAANAGKSSLMNALTGLDRSICSAVAGTTRDLLSAPLALGRGEAILLDAAGHAAEMGPISTLADQRTRAAAQQADLICLVIDLAQEPDQTVWEPLKDLPGRSAVVAANKVDLLDPQTVGRRVGQLAAAGVGRVCPVSAAQGSGLTGLREAIGDRFADPGAAGGGALALTARQRASLEACFAAIERAWHLAADARETIDCADTLALEIREALEALGTVTGTVTTEDVLGRIFASFCIGK